MRIYLFLFVLVHCVFAQAKSMIAFERYGSIWTANMDGSNAKKITEGYIPEISPDGKYIAYNVVDNSKSANRFLAIIALATGKVTLLKNVPSSNSFNPVWSPDSQKLLFNTFIGSDWHLALINADGSGYRIIKNTQNEYSPAWAANGASFFSHDLNAIYWMDFEGNLIKKWRLNEIIAHSSMSSGSHIHVAPDGKTLIMDVDMDENIHRKNWNEPPLALWTFALDSEKAIRITPKGVLAWSPFWINSEEFIFLEQGIKEKSPSLFRGSIKSPSKTQLLENVQTPSVSR
ncbi:TolB family protein [Fluoribacter gormanii]|uniref:TolB protein n=1 Tax=Fluoribacter gormanii TaxID=464 RepID=A0A377GMU8_9GAMM|nr:PD40 domain-containing protein [Fluoribacter gormanii]KTD04461.1 acylaminoacyl peptidase [Fluoribacter gormanii]MCW8445482.1 PD40 domain-containing protein [Fluoribacter gormanii]SIR89239.1 TolB protein [Fluoribacter gormanii]STO26150.1 translocation protein TolB [Fluoribacter gormanii]